MSTHMLETHEELPGSGRPMDGSGALSALTTKLASLESVPTLEQLEAWLGGAEVTGEELRPYRTFKPGTYARHRVFRNDFAELLVLCWRPGQRTPIHDHNGSHGVVRVCEGVLWETMFLL